MKTVTIEELLTWAFVHELPKGGGIDGLENMNSAWRMLQASSWGKIARYGELMTLIDTGWRGGGDNYFIEQGEPHPDAIAVGRAVADLIHHDFVLPEGWHGLADWPRDDPVLAQLADEANARVVAQWHARPQRQRAASVINLVIRCAVLGRPPEHDAPVSKVRMVQRGGKPAWFVKRTVKDWNGQPREIEVDGYDRKRGRPVKGAYRRYALSTGPDGDIISRIERRVWQLAIDALSEIHSELKTVRSVEPTSTAGARVCRNIKEKK